MCEVANRPSDDANRPRLRIEPRRVRQVLIAAASVALFLAIVGELGRNFSVDDDRPLPQALRTIRRNFNPSGEQTVGSWLTASVLLLCGIALLGIAAATRARGSDYVRHWRVLGAIFFFLSADEAVAFHEQLGDWVQRRIETGGPFLWAWVLPYGLAAAGLAVVYLPFLRALPAESRRRIFLAGALFVGGALGLEMVQAAIVDGRGRGGGPVSVLAIIEEGAELLGAILFLDALLLYAAAYLPVVVSLDAPKEAPQDADASAVRPDDTAHTVTPAGVNLREPLPPA